MPKFPSDYYTTFEVITKLGIDRFFLTKLAKKQKWQVRKFSRKAYYIKEEIEKYCSLEGWILKRKGAELINCPWQSFGKLCKTFHIRTKDIKHIRYVYINDLYQQGVVEYLSLDGLVNYQEAISLLKCSKRDFNVVIKSNNVKFKTLFQKKYFNKSDLINIVRNNENWVNKKAALNLLKCDSKVFKTLIKKYNIPETVYARHKVYYLPEILTHRTA